MRAFSFLFFLISAVSANCQNYYLFVGTYTNNTTSKGIYVYQFSETNGTIDSLNHTETTVANPSFLTIAPNGNYVYACTEAATTNGGSVNAFAFNKENGTLKFINKQSSGGDDPAYLSVDKDNKWLVSGNYTGGNLTVYPVNADGSLEPFSQLIQHTGTGADKTRQEKAHVHAAVFSPSGKQLLVTDLGTDKIMCYTFNGTLKKPLQTTSPEFVATEPGSGPRHLAFHPNGKYVYCMEELSGAVSVYNYTGDKLTALQRIPTHPVTSKGPFGSSDIHLSPDGLFLYAANRADENTITIFSVAATGKLTLVGYQPTLGKTPRNFIITPSGKFLLVANQLTGTIVVFKRNIKTGMLEQTGKQLQVPAPTCLQLMKR